MKSNDDVQAPIPIVPFNSYPLAPFIAIAYLISWTIWLPLVLSRFGQDWIVLLPHHHYLGSIGPALSALIVIRGRAGTSEVGRFLKGSLIVPGQLKWILLGMVSPFALAFLGVAMSFVTTGNWLGFAAILRMPEFSGWSILSVFLFQGMTFGLGEELGWRGYLLPRLQRDRSPVRATFLLSGIWALWHLPAFAYRPGYTSMGVFNIVGWFISLLAGAVLLTWLYNSSRGSILAVIFFHIGVEFAFMSEIAEGENAAYIGTAFIMAALLVLIITGRKRLSSARTRDQAAEPGPKCAPNR